jgi:hypothetical protein
MRCWPALAATRLLLELLLLAMLLPVQLVLLLLLLRLLPMALPRCRLLLSPLPLHEDARWACAAALCKWRLTVRGLAPACDISSCVSLWGEQCSYRCNAPMQHARKARTGGGKRKLGHKAPLGMAAAL